MMLRKSTKVFHKRLSIAWPELLIVSVALFLFTYQLGTESFWIDEILSVESARGPLNLNRPLYFVLLRFWMLLGQSDVWLRSLSVLFGFGSVVLTYCLGRKLASRTAGQMSALLMALSPLVINHSQEVRFYMMSTFLGLAGSLCLSYALQQKTTKLSRALLSWIVLRCLGFLTAQPNILLLLPDLILIAWKVLRSLASTRQIGQVRWRYWLLGSLLLLVPTAIILSDVIPELLEFLSYTTHVSSEKPGFLNLLGKLAALSVWPLRGPVAEGLAPLYSLLFKLYSIVVLALIGFAVCRAIAQSSKLLQAALWGLLPIFSIFAVSQAFPVLWEDRYALISAPYVLILLSAAWLRLWHCQKAIASLLVLLYVLAVSGPLLRYYTTDYRADWRGLSQAVAQRVEPGEPVLVYPGSFVEILDYYYDGDANFLPLDDVVAAEDLDVGEAVSLVQNADLESDRFWIICPVVEPWNEAKAELLLLLEQEDFELQQENYFLDQWAWGPVLYLVSK